jgi:hypothetical protein
MKFSEKRIGEDMSRRKLTSAKVVIVEVEKDNSLTQAAAWNIVSPVIVRILAKAIKANESESLYPVMSISKQVTVETNFKSTR